MPERNVGGRDRAARGILGAGLLVLAVVAYRRNAGSMAAVTALAAGGLLFNALTQFCGCNAVLGVDTTAEE